MTENTGSDFSWSEEGVEAFTRRLPGDCVEYCMFIVDAKLPALELRQRLRSIQNEARSMAKSLCKDYIWHKESFGVDLASDHSAKKVEHHESRSNEYHSTRPFLRGKTTFGDSIEDEWLIVYILRSLSVKFQDLWIRVVDADGQFLLAEAANVLPRWLNPDNAEFRVWIHQGKLLIIPRTSFSKDAAPEDTPAAELTLDTALRFIEDSPSRLLHLSDVQEEAFYRVQHYPQKIQDGLHHALVVIPRKLAWLLHQGPSYISPAIEAFYLRDPISLRSLEKPPASTFLFPLTDFVTISAKFPKIGYAQLVGQRFESPETSLTMDASATSSKAQRSGLDTGKRLTAGFEMLLSDPQYRDQRAVREIKILLDDMANGEAQFPSDEDLRTWSQRADDEQWLNVDYAAFEKSLSGESKRGQWDTAGFSDQVMEEHLRKITARFTDLMQDEEKGPEDVEFLDSENERLSISDDASSGDGENDGIDLDGERFEKLMAEIMGSASKHDRSAPGVVTGDRGAEATSSASALRRDMLQHAQDVEAELHEAGALNRDNPG